MPHIHLEYSDNLKNLDTKPILHALNQALVDGKYVAAANEVKSRAIIQSDFLIGLDAQSNQAYIHVKVSLLSGRSEEIKQEISDVLLHSLEKSVVKPESLTLQLCVEILEMPKATYRKVIL